MTGIQPSGFIAVSDPIAELAANMAAFKVDTEVRREEAAEAREGAFQGADAQEKNTALELLKENQVLTTLFAHAQKELDVAKQEIANLKRNIVVLKSDLEKAEEKNNRLQEGVKSLVKSLEEKHSVEPIPPDHHIYAECLTPYSFQKKVASVNEKYGLEVALFQTYEGLEQLEKVEISI